MFKLLIVDDEAETRKGIEAHMPWQSLGIGEVRLAGGGVEGMRICSTYAPDIVISDISMPDMNGIDMCRTMRDLLPRCQIIFISAYADKENLKAAIALDAVSFVEKPISLDELAAAVRKATQKLEQESGPAAGQVHLPVLQELTVLNIASGNTAGGIAPALAAAGLFQQGEAYFRVLFLRASGEMPCEGGFKALVAEKMAETFPGLSRVCAGRDTRQVIVVLAGKCRPALDVRGDAWQRLEGWVSQHDECGIRLYCAVGRCEEEPEGIAASYRQAVLSLQRLFFDGYGAGCYHHDEPAPAELDENAYIQRLDKLLVDGRREEIGGFLEETYRALSRETGASVTQIRNLYMKLGHMLIEARAPKGVEQSRSHHYLWEKIQGFETLAEVQAHITGLAAALADEGYSALVRKTIELIAQRYGEENLKIKQLADAAYVSPSYLSRVFKEETGKTVMEYITGVRMEHAKRLLADPGLKLYHVAMMVGYGGPSYFAKVFKKETGLMPSDWRARLPQGEPR